MRLRFSKIDDLSRPDHWRLGADDACMYLREYTAGRNFEFGETNNLISNFKKEMDRKGRQEWQYKEQAIRQFGDEVADALNAEHLRGLVFVPIPPSKPKHDPMYDDRVCKVLSRVQDRLGDVVQIREIVWQKASREAAHTSGHRLSPDEHKNNYEVDVSVLDFEPKAILIFDDVITTGSSYIAMRDTLREHCPNTGITGMFIARCIHE